MKNLWLGLFAIMIVHIKDNVFQIIDTDNKVICYIVSDNKRDFYGTFPKTMSCVALTTEPIPAKEEK